MTPKQIIAIIGFSYIASTTVLTPIMSIYLKYIVLLPTDLIGFIVGLFYVTSALVKVPVGVYAGGRKTILLLAAAFVVFCSCPVLYLLSNYPLVLIILRTAQGLTYGFIGTVGIVLAALTVPSDERAKAMSSYAASLSLGFLAGPVITTLCVPVFGVSNTFYFASMMGLFGFFASVFLYRKMSAIESVWQVVSANVAREPIGRKLSEIVHNRLFWSAFVSNFVFYFMFGVILAYSPLYAKTSLGFTDQFVSLLFLLYYAATTVTRFAAGRIIVRDKKSKPKLITICTGLAATLALLLALFSGAEAFIALFALIGAVQGVIFPLGSLLVAESIRPSRSVLANSLYFTGIDLSQGASPVILGWLAASYGFQYVLIGSATVAFAGTAMLIGIRKGENWSSH